MQAFVDRLAPAPSEADKLAAAGDEASLRKALETEPGHVAAVLGLAELLAARGDGEEALALLARIPETADVRRVAALARDRPGGRGRHRRRRAEARPRCSTRVKDDDDARQQFVDLLEVLGPDDPRTAEWRKRLTTALF